MRRDVLAKTAQSHKYTAQQAFTLTEIAIVLGIIGLIMGAIWVAASTVYQNMHVTKALTEMGDIAQAIRNLAGSQQVVDNNNANYNLTSSFYDAAVYPKDMVEVPWTGPGLVAMSGPWEGSIFVVGAAQTSSNNPSSQPGDAFSIQVGMIPVSACIALSTAASASGQSNGLIEIGFGILPGGPQVASPNDTAGSLVNFPVGPNDVLSRCTGVNQGGPMTLVFVYSLHP